MLKTKVTVIGNSSGIILPKEALAKLKANKGDFIYLIETTNDYVSYDEQFVDQTRRSLNAYQNFNKTIFLIRR